MSTPLPGSAPSQDVFNLTNDARQVGLAARFLTSLNVHAKVSLVSLVSPVSPLEGEPAMELINVHQAKTHLSRLLERVIAGEEIVIAKSGRPVAKLVRFPTQPRKPGRLKGKIRMAPDFDAPLPDSIAAAFRGETE